MIEKQLLRNCYKITAEDNVIIDDNRYVVYEERTVVRFDISDRSLMDRTPDSDSGNAGSIPAGRIFF